MVLQAPKFIYGDNNFECVNTSTSYLGYGSIERSRDARHKSVQVLNFEFPKGVD
ncbi:hypothetical protein NSTC731_05826 [Nostoc sp. DSM 114167]